MVYDDSTSMLEMALKHSDDDSSDGSTDSECLQ